MKLNFGCLINKEGFSGGVDYETLLSYKDKEEQIKKGVFESDKAMLGWLDSPYIAIDELNDVKRYAKFINENYTSFVVFGIGGSALGAIALNSAIGKDRNSGTKVLVVDNVDPEEFNAMLEKVELSKTMFNVVTKSGSTVETLSQLSIIISILNKNNLKPSEHICITTENDNALYDFAVTNNIKHFNIEKMVGGRFSVLGNVGLLPFYVMGGDGEKLLEGARTLLQESRNLPLENNLPLLSAVINYSLMKDGKDEIVVFPYSYSLKTMSDFYLQLLGESLGKKNKLNGSENTLNLTPIKAVGVTDQHSQMQLYFEGLNTKIFFIIGQDSFNSEVEVPSLNIGSFNDNVPPTLGALLNTERDATMFALYNANKPCYKLTLEKVDEYEVGKLIMYFFLVTAFMGELMEINAYDQPGVESGKINTKALLNNKKFITQKEELLVVKNACDKYTI